MKKSMTKLEEGMLLYNPDWGCTGRIKRRISRYIWEAELVMLTPDGYQQLGYISTRMLKKIKIIS